MGLAHSRLILENPCKPALRPLEMNAVADAGDVYLRIPQTVADQLELAEVGKKRVVTGDGETQTCPYVGPLLVRFANRGCFAGAVVLGDEVLLGAIPLADMDLVVLPHTRQVAVHPEHACRG